MDNDKLLLRTEKFAIYERSYEAGGKRHHKAIIDHPGAVCILPLLEDGSVILIRNHRVAVGEELVELPAGTCEPGEDPVSTARRELREETGYQARSLSKLPAFWMSPGILRERMHLFVATGLIPGPQSLAEGERIEHFALPWEEAMSWIKAEKIQDAKTLVALLYFDRYCHSGDR